MSCAERNFLPGSLRLLAFEGFFSSDAVMKGRFQGLTVP